MAKACIADVGAVRVVIPVTAFNFSYPRVIKSVVSERHSVCLSITLRRI